MMKIIADENLAFTDYFFSDFGQIETLAGRTLTNQHLKASQALLVRSVTKVNQALLQDTNIGFVGSATIGTDHLDIAYLESQNINWANAAGCNAQAVAEYVVTALLTLKPEMIDAQQNFCLGIIGLGNVGQSLAALANTLGWRVIGYDPFVKRDNIPQLELTQLLESADAVSIHVPLTKVGTHPTHHLFNQQRLTQLKPNAILINSARGSVIEETALMADIVENKRQVVLDVFEHEPIISKQLLDLVTLVTPHIAGYSLEGKARGTQMIYEAFCQHFEFKADKHFETQLETCPQLFKDSNFKTILIENLKHFYDIRQDDANLRACLKDGFIDQTSFDRLRKEYPLRREWSAYGAQQ